MSAPGTPQDRRLTDAELDAVARAIGYASAGAAEAAFAVADRERLEGKRARRSWPALVNPVLAERIAEIRGEVPAPPTYTPTAEDIAESARAAAEDAARRQRRSEAARQARLAVLARQRGETGETGEAAS